VPIASRQDEELESRMDISQKAVSMGRALRSMHNLKNRQPLKVFYLVTRNDQEKRVLREMEDIIRDELNVKEIEFRDNEEDLVEYSAKANFKVLGQKLGKDMKDAAALIAKFEPSEIISLMEGNILNVEINGRSIDLDAETIIIQRTEKQGLKVLNQGSLTVALDPVLSPELVYEGWARDFIRAIQNLRKEKGLEVSDRIELTVDAQGELREAVDAFRDFICAETLCVDIRWAEAPLSERLDSADLDCGVHLKKVRI